MTETEVLVGPEMIMPGQTGYEPEPHPTKGELRSITRTARRRAASAERTRINEDVAEHVLGPMQPLSAGKVDVSKHTSSTMPWLVPQTVWVDGITPRQMRSGFAKPTGETPVASKNPQGK